MTLSHDSKLFHIAVGRRWKGTRVRLYVADLEVRIVTCDGRLVRLLTLDPQISAEWAPRYRVREGSDGPR